MNISDYEFEKEHLEASRLAVIEESDKRKALLENHTAVQNMLAEIVKQAAEWTTLDRWAQDALDAVKLGKPVDIIQLQANIQAWAASRQGGGQ